MEIIQPIWHAAQQYGHKENCASVNWKSYGHLQQNTDGQVRKQWCGILRNSTGLVLKFTFLVMQVMRTRKMHKKGKLVKHPAPNSKKTEGLKSYVFKALVSCNGLAKPERSQYHIYTWKWNSWHRAKYSVGIKKDWRFMGKGKYTMKPNIC